MRKEEPLVRIIKDKTRFFIKRAQPLFKLIPSYQRAYEEEARLAQSWKHSNLFTCLGLVDLETEKAICYKYEAASLLSKVLLVDSENIYYEVDHIVNQLLDVVSYIHDKGGVHADIHPGNIYITKNDSKLKLINCAQAYLNLSPSFHLLRSNYTAPELLADTAEPNVLSDIYSIGKTIEYIYSYSRVTTGIDKVIKKATQTNPKRRYATVEEMKAAFNQKKYWDLSAMALKVAVCFGVMFFFFFLLDTEKPTEENLFFFEESKSHQTKLAIERDVNYTNIPSSTQEFGTIREVEEKLQISESIFNKEFRKAALPIIQRIYTPQLMNGSQQKFQEESLDGFEELDNIQKGLANELELPLRIANSIASNIISELTEESMKNLTKTNKKQD